MRSKGTVPFPENSWFKRYFDRKYWRDISEEQALLEIEKICYERRMDFKNTLRNIKKGGMNLEGRYAEYIFVKDSLYQDELPMNYRLLFK